MKKTAPRGSIRVARVYGIDVRLHWTFLALVLVVVWVYSSSGMGQVATGLCWIVVVFGSVLVHEFSHCAVARRFGVAVEDILLIPIGGVSQMEKIPEDPDQEFAISVVGPLTSLALGIVGACAGLLLGARMWPPTLFAGAWIARISWLNFALAAFNFVPALPMDGGRILRSWLARHRDRKEATIVAGKVARILAVLMIVGGLLYNFLLAVIGLFVWLGAFAEEQAVQHPDSPSDHRDGDDGHGPGGGSPIHALGPGTSPRNEPPSAGSH